MRITTAPEALPGSCYICGSASRDRYIDTGLQVEFHGAMYLCDLCVSEMGDLLGFLAPDRVEKLRSEVTFLKQMHYEYKRQIDGLELIVNGFTLNRGLTGTDSIRDSAVSTQKPDPNLFEPESYLGEGAGEVTESLHDSKVDGLPADESAAKSPDFTFNI